MKKVLCTLFAVVFCFGLCVNFSSCAIFFGIGSGKEGFVKKSYLKAAGLAGLSKPDFTYKDSDGYSIRGVIEREEFDKYVQEVFTYLTKKYDYVGISGVEYSSFFGGAGKYRYLECEKVLSSYETGDGVGRVAYQFIFFRKTPKDGAETTDKVSLLWHAKPFKIGNSEERYNFIMGFKNFDGLKDTYIYTNRLDYETICSYGTSNWSEEKEYPYVAVAHSQTELDAYLGEPWYDSNYDFSKSFLVAIQLSTGSSADAYRLVSSEKQEDGRYVFTIEYLTTAEVGTAVMGEYNIALDVENYEPIDSPEDIILNFI